MPGRRNHRIIAVVATIMAYCLIRRIQNKEIKLGELAISAIGGGFIGCLPDFLEPAVRNPNHRAFFHSLASLLALIGINYVSWRDEKLTDDQKAVLSLLSVAYGSHLIADATTPKGLPLI